ncbi:hypothetical protein PR002_g6180 [Phytophthora rubi]|uniref:Uncharacterized protein n=1 Tax=Phytophthora rubi TaxID=129364 RepID=A0A6A3N1Z0_9STRA|nr:hypothetical protein PR002_g6180 [Phytophthora rubi]
MAVQALTETSVKNLTEQQRIIVEKLGEAFTATHAGLHEQFQRMQMVQDERGVQIERFVNDRLAQSLQDVQRETSESKLANSAQVDGVHHRLEVVATKVDEELEKIMAQIHQLVEAKFMAYQNQMRLGQETKLLVQQQVEAAYEGVKAAIKISLEKDIHRACEAIRQELLQTVNRAEEPLRESIRALACEITSNAEVRMQKTLTNTQSDLHLQIQRQADATAALRDQVRKQGVRIRKQCRLHDDVELEVTIAEMVQKEVQQRLNAVQSERALAPVDASEQETTLQVQPDETRNLIDDSIQSAVEVICKTIKNEVRTMAPNPEQPKTQQSPVNDATDTNEDCGATNDDYQLERRMQEAWRRTYLDDSHSVSQVEPSSTDQEMSSGGDFVSQRGSGPEVEPLREPIDVWENAQQQQHSEHRHQQTVRVNLRAVISEIQLQVAVRAEMAARRYLSSKKKSRKK